jgi:hypothetical protein
MRGGTRFTSPRWSLPVAPPAQIKLEPGGMQERFCGQPQHFCFIGADCAIVLPGSCGSRRVAAKITTGRTAGRACTRVRIVKSLSRGCFAAFSKLRGGVSSCPPPPARPPPPAALRIAPPPPSTPPAQTRNARAPTGMRMREAIPAALTPLSLPYLKSRSRKRADAQEKWRQGLASLRHTAGDRVRSDQQPQSTQPRMLVASSKHITCYAHRAECCSRDDSEIRLKSAGVSVFKVEEQSTFKLFACRVGDSRCSGCIYSNPVILTNLRNSARRTCKYNNELIAGWACSTMTGAMIGANPCLVIHQRKCPKRLSHKKKKNSPLAGTPLGTGPTTYLIIKYMNPGSHGVYQIQVRRLGVSHRRGGTCVIARIRRIILCNIILILSFNNLSP